MYYLTVDRRMVEDCGEPFVVMTNSPAKRFDCRGEPAFCAAQWPGAVCSIDGKEQGCTDGRCGRCGGLVGRTTPAANTPQPEPSMRPIVLLVCLFTLLAPSSASAA